MCRFPFLGTIAITVLTIASGSYGQTPESAAQVSGQAASQTATRATSQAGSSAGNQAVVAANTQINATLESTVDAKKAKPGDEVAAKVTKDVKQDGQVIIHKGDRLLGRIVSTGANGIADAGSQIAVQFDRLKSGGATTQLRTVVTSVLNVSAGPPNEEVAGFGGAAPMAMPASQAGAGGSSAGGGLLGGVGSTVGSTLGAAGSLGGNAGGVLDATAGSTIGFSGAVAGSTPGRAIHVESQGSASQSTGLNSVFSAPQGNLRLDSGTTMQFRVVGQAEQPAAPNSQ
ncbi:MAG: hypothetical protein HYX73_00525 [Acidobacteria bacterium]|nr:hypothetical protein [Acidobacteriota bacterium]